MIARHCPSCGTALAERPPTRCRACGVELWRNAKPAACALVVRGRELLLVRRALAPWAEAWCAPGGFCDAGEHPVDAAVRETQEETGYGIQVTGFAGIWLDRYADDETDGDADEISVAYYFAEPLGRPATGFDETEAAEIAWFDVDELPALLAPPRTLAEILRRARFAILAGETRTAMLDR